MTAITTDTVVDVRNRPDLTAYGLVLAIEGNQATVEFSLPRLPKERGVCDSCGWPGFISVGPGPNGNRELVCMRRGCGHGHGFSKRKEIIDVSDLINITEKRAHDAKKAMCDCIWKEVLSRFSSVDLTLRIKIRDAAKEILELS